MENRKLRVLLVILVILSMVCCSACARKTTWQEQYDLGVRYLSEGKYMEAIVAFSAAIKIDPKRPAAYLGRADAYAASGNHEAAERDRATAQKLVSSTEQEPEQTEAAAATEPEQTVEKQLLRVNVYSQGALCQVDTLYYDGQGRLVNANINYKDSLNTSIWCTYSYDASGRLIFADRDDFWVNFMNDAYVYNDAGQLISHREYWGGSELPYHEYVFTYDSSGRIESEQIILLMYGTNEYQEQIGEAVYEYDSSGRALKRLEETFGGEYTYVTDYAYDEQDRLVSERADGYETTYYYDYKTIVVSKTSGGYTTLAIHDIMGHEIWSLGIVEGEIIAQDGYIMEVLDDSEDKRYEFIYGEPADVPEVEPGQEDYSAFLRDKGYEADWSAMYTDGPPTSYALIDINQDGHDELVLVGDEWMGFCRFLVYGVDEHRQITQLEVWENASYTLSSCFGSLEYSPEHRALAFSETKATTMEGGWGYYTVSESGMKLDTLFHVAWEGEGDQRMYYRYSESGSRQISEADKDAYLEELQPLDYSPIP